MKRRILTFITSMLLVLTLTSLTVVATGTVKDDGAVATKSLTGGQRPEATRITGARYQFGDSRWVLGGGINMLGNIKCETDEEIYALEQKLPFNNYVLVTTDDKDISDEDFKTLTEGNFAPPFAEYYERSEFGWDMKMYKVYLYKPSLDDALEQLRTRDYVSDEVSVELYTSAVMIDYGINFFGNRVGKILNEFNDNIPSWYTSTGYLEIRSPIDAEVVLEMDAERSYEVLYVRGGEPLLVKMKEGRHIVREINYTGIARSEEAIAPKNALTVRQGEHTIDNPLIMELAGAVDKYDIKPIVISDKPDYSWGNKDNLTREDYLLPAETVVVDVSDVESPPEKSKSNVFTIILIIVIAIVLVIIFKKWGKSDEQ